ncbi:MAG: helix-turn-helix transcriptional regulator [Gemmatimonadaceae bacterium]|nr:helix-turn-helix transcriptional regulator [Gemmatimonadaceae bacterium]
MTSVADSRGHLALPFGAFYGQLDVRRHAPGLDVAVLDVDPHRVVERHSHDDAHFVLVLSGLYVSSAAGAPPLSNGPALIFNPAGTTHRDRFETRERRFEGRFLTLSVARVLADSRLSGARLPDSSRSITSPTALALANQLAQECASAFDDATAMQESLAHAMIATVAQPSDGFDATDAPAWLGIARECLDDQCNRDVRVSDVARIVGVHPVHLARVFQRYVGCAPGEYLRRRRVVLACALLRQTVRPLSDIAEACGFVDQSHFANVFRRRMGVTPSGYRAQTRR